MEIFLGSMVIIFVVLMVIDKRSRNKENHMKLVYNNASYAFMFTLACTVVIFSFGLMFLSLLTLYRWIFETKEFIIFSFDFLLFLVGLFIWIPGLHWGEGVYGMIKEYLKKQDDE